MNLQGFHLFLNSFKFNRFFLKRNGVGSFQFDGILVFVAVFFGDHKKYIDVFQFGQTFG